MFNWLNNLIETGVSFGVVIFALLFVVMYLVGRFIPPVHVAVPQFRAMTAIAGFIAGILGLIRVGMWAIVLLNSQAEIDKLKGQLDAKQDRIDELEDTSGRKQTQGIEVDTADRKADVIYDTKWRTIEKIVKQPDMTLANRLALDLTVNFYTGVDEVPNETPAN